MRILLVDDHSVFREGLGVLLASRDPSLKIVGEASTARESIASVLDLAPDVVVMDVVLGGVNGIAALRELRRLKAPARVLILTAVAEAGYVRDAFAAGADGYALKEESVEDILVGIRTVARGARYVAPRLEPAVASPSPETSAPDWPGPLGSLTVREREVFGLIVAGRTNQEIASELFISVKTVETHHMRINKKLGVHSTTELLRKAALAGLITA